MKFNINETDLDDLK